MRVDIIFCLVPKKLFGGWSLTGNGFCYYPEIFGRLNIPALCYLNDIEIGGRMWNLIPIPKCHTPYTQFLEVFHKCIGL